ncbi:MAG: DUF1653 domain-containing protein [Roseinatronobacter sp.]
MDDLADKACTHYKGGKYHIIGIAKHSEDHSEFVIYRCDNSGTIWARPRESFFGTVMIDGNETFRFKFERND